MFNNNQGAGQETQKPIQGKSKSRLAGTEQTEIEKVIGLKQWWIDEIDVDTAEMDEEEEGSKWKCSDLKESKKV